MSLFQIAEPGESQVKEACRGRVVGIDLGTTNSLVAYVQDGTPVCIRDEEEHALLPSAVQYRKAGPPIVGREALHRAAAAPHDTITSVKRFMGRGPEDARAAQKGRLLSYRIADETAKDAQSDWTVVRFVVAGEGSDTGRQVTPVEVSAEILRALRQRAEEALGGELEGAVITVPAYFDDAQRQATRDAGRLAGLNVLRLLNEPTAAALAYGLDKKKKGKFAVYDLGGGTFDISILDLQDGVFTVLSTAGDTALGGDDMDRALCDLLLARHGGDLADRARRDAGLGQRLLQRAREVKHLLTESAQVALSLVDEEEADVVLTREEFEAAIAPILARTATPCRRALKDAELRAEDLDGVVLVGGATRVPAVRRLVAQLFKREALFDLDPDQVVALGAAVQAEIISSERTDMLLIDVTPLSLGLELMGGVVEKVLPRNSRIPTGAKQVFTTYADGQTGFDLHVVQGERETAPECRSLARFQLKGIPPMTAGMARLEVSFLIDENGILQVSARELHSGRETHIEVKPSYGLTDEQIEQMLLDSYEHAEEDVKRRLLLEQRVEAERILQALRSALLVDGPLLPAAERAAIDRAAEALAEAAQGENHRLIADCIEALDRTSQGFAQRRMDAGLSRGVKGRSLHEVEQAVHYDETVGQHAGCQSAAVAAAPAE
jgi:molecular chaperone HscA